MTEYDFSPAAYDRYMANQTRVSNWVDAQPHHPRDYSNPFSPTAAHARVSSRPTTPSNSRPKAISRSQTSHEKERRSHSQPRDSRHKPTRSQTLPAPPPAALAHPQPVYPGMNTTQAVLVPSPVQSPRERESRSRTGSRARSPSKNHRSHHPSRSYTTPAPTQKIIQLDASSNGQVIHVPPPKDGEQYLIFPPPGGKVEVLSSQEYDKGHGARLDRRRSERKSSKRKEAEPTSKPLLKRIFGGLLGGGVQADSGTSSKLKHTASLRRRRSY